MKSHLKETDKIFIFFKGQLMIDQRIQKIFKFISRKYIKVLAFTNYLWRHNIIINWVVSLDLIEFKTINDKLSIWIDFWSLLELEIGKFEEVRFFVNLYSLFHHQIIKSRDKILFLIVFLILLKQVKNAENGTEYRFLRPRHFNYVVC